MSDTDKCPGCDGTGVVDSGGVTPWGTGIDIACPCCGGDGETIPCPDCDGKGGDPYITSHGDWEWEDCGRCQGNGVIGAKAKGVDR